MSKQDTGKVIQFPGAQAGQPPKRPVGTPPPPRAKNKSLTMGASVLAIALATLAVNRYAFRQPTQSAQLSSMSRGIASVEPMRIVRDAAWEKHLAESLASTQVRDVASSRLGHPATLEEKLRWGTLEEKYTIDYDPKFHKISHILLQDKSIAPAYVLNRDQFLENYGTLFSPHFYSAKLGSVSHKDGKTLESYTIFDKDRHSEGKVRFVLDRYKRLLSMQVDPVNI